MSGVLLVLPSNAHVEARLRTSSSSLDSREIRSSPQLTTLSRLEGDLARALLPGLRVASNPVVRIALRRAVDESDAARSLVAAAGLSSDHVLDALDRTIGELHHAGVDASVMEAAASRGSRKRDAVRGSLLAEVMHGLDRELARLGSIDGRTIAARLANVLSREPSEERDLDHAVRAALGGASEVEVHDVASFSPARLAWIEALQIVLERTHGGVTVELPTASGDLFGTCGIDDPREVLAARLEDRWARLVAPPMLLHRTAGSTEGPFSRLAGGLFVRSTARATSEANDGDEQSTFTARATPTILRAASTAIAVDAVACRVAAALRAGVPPSRVVIAMPTLEEAIVRPLRAALARLSVPTFEARGAPPTSVPAIARVLHVLRCVDRGLRKEDLVDLLRMGRAVGSSRRHGIARRLEQIAGSDLVSDGAAILDRLPATERDRDRAILDPIVRTLVAGREACATRGAAVRFVLAVAELTGLSRAFDRESTSAIVRAEDPDVIAAMASEATALRAFTTAIDDLVRANELAAAGDVSTSLSETILELEGALEDRRLVVGSRAGAVPIVRLRDRFGLEADVLFVMEAHDGALPARPTSDPLLPRGLVTALRDYDERRAPPPRALTSAVDLLAAIDAIAGTRREVFIVERAIDDDGRAMLPGALALEIQRTAPNTKMVAERGRLIPSSHVPARRPGDRALFEHRKAAGRLLAGGSIGSTFPDVDPSAIARASAELSRGRAFATSAISGPKAPGELSATSALDLDDVLRARLSTRLRGGPEAPFPVTSVDALLECPFVAFAERVLGAKRDDPTQLDGGARDAGIVAHEALLKIYRRLRDEGVPVGEPASRLARVAEVARAVATEVIDPTSMPGSLQRLRREKVIDQVVNLTVRDHEEMLSAGGALRRFVEGEVGFGVVDARWPALVLGGSVGKEVSPTVTIQGRIDRYDLAVEPDGRRSATVVDYKSRSPDGMTLPTFFLGKGVQVALYARVLAQNLEPRPERVEARFFGYKKAQLGSVVGVKGGAKRDDSVWRAQVGDAAGDEGEGEVAHRVLAAFEEFRAGNVTPRRGPRCEHCDQRVACRAPDVVLADNQRE